MDWLFTFSYILTVTFYSTTAAIPTAFLGSGKLRSTLLGAFAGALFGVMTSVPVIPMDDIRNPEAAICFALVYVTLACGLTAQEMSRKRWRQSLVAIGLQSALGILCLLTHSFLTPVSDARAIGVAYCVLLGGIVLPVFIGLGCFTGFIPVCLNAEISRLFNWWGSYQDPIE